MALQPKLRHALTLVASAATVAGCARSTTSSSMNATPATSATATTAPAAAAAHTPSHGSVTLTGAETPNPDPRVGLRAGEGNTAASASWNMTLVSNTPASAKFAGSTNSDLAFLGNYVIQGNYNGYQVWDVSNPASPSLTLGNFCPASQSDVSVYRNLLFVSAEAPSARLDCGAEGVQDTVSKERIRGLRIYDISDIRNPKYIANVQTCRGSHTHTVLTDPNDKDNVYVYISGSAGVRSPSELPGCSKLQPSQDPNSALFRIEVIKVPLAHPEQAKIVSSPRIFENLVAPPRHGAAPEDKAAQKRMADSVRAAGGYVINVMGDEMPAPKRFIDPLLDSIVKARGGTGAPTKADSAALRASLQGIIDKMIGEQPSGPNGQRPGPTQCHDITVYPAIGLAGGACEGYGLLLDIRDPVNPKRIAAVSDSNFSYWHSATFNNDGTKILFSDEWGGGGQPKCRATDKKEWGADAIFTISADKQLTFQGYYKMPAAQTPFENCVAHNGSLIPVPGRDLMVQAWYQGGVSVFDWTDPAHPKEIAFFDRGPVDSTRMGSGGSWSAYWYNGAIYSSEISRGLDVFTLQPNALLTQNEIDAAKSAQLPYLNVQDQPKYTWPASFAVARAYLDQLERSNGLAADRIAAVRQALDGAEKSAGAARKTALTQLATQLHGEATSAGDQAKVHALATAVGNLANAKS
ncbi:MAG TPA: hypothetical protein VFS40_13170 [Gemmatimonadales bacterium]|nr:hypothetical protein [Gemmatimonadales bacterium]